MTKIIAFYVILVVRGVELGEFCVILQRSSEQRHIETTKRYARLVVRNVGNFQMICKDSVMVRAYSVD